MSWQEEAQAEMWDAIAEQDRALERRLEERIEQRDELEPTPAAADAYNGKTSGLREALELAREHDPATWTIPSDGYADGGTPYSAEELEPRCKGCGSSEISEPWEMDGMSGGKYHERGLFWRSCRSCGRTTLDRKEASA